MKHSFSLGVDHGQDHIDFGPGSGSVLHPDSGFPRSAPGAGAQRCPVQVGRRTEPGSLAGELNFEKPL